MPSVARLYPARMDHNGVVWYRPERVAGKSGDQWGWTSCAEQADKSYFDEGAPDVKAPVTDKQKQIAKLERAMDARREEMERLVVDFGVGITTEFNFGVQRGRYEGLGAALAAVRGGGAKLADEIARSNDRLGIS